VLIVEDDEAMRSQWQWALADDYDVLLAGDRASAVETFCAHRPELSLLDLGLPPRTHDPSEGMAVLARIRSLDRQAKVIVISGLTDSGENAIRAVGEGACDFLSKPVPIAELKLLLQHCHHVATLEREFLARQQGSEDPDFEGLHGRSPQMQEVFAAIRKVAPADAPVFILGESGTGKETAARAIHRLSARGRGPFVAVDCSAIPPELLETELFGEEEGGSGGASSRRPGRIELASTGTLFLHGVAELPLSSQVRLLRLLQNRQIERVGSHESISVDTRVIAAANADPATALAAGQLRSDLYYLLAVVVLRLPPLRELKEDIHLLAGMLLHKFSELYHKPSLQLGAEARRALERYPWPGNVRELENCLKRAVIMAERDTLGEADLDLPAAVPAPPPAATGLREARQGTEREMILRALQRHHGRIAPAAAALGISRPTFYALMHRLGIRRSSDSAPDPQAPYEGEGNGI